MKAIRKLTVRTTLPTRLASLETLATNLRWSWHQPTRDLFRELSVEGWRATGHDPVQLLGWIGTARLDELAADDAFVSRVDRLADDLDDYLSQARWYQSLDNTPSGIAYFSPEFGITSALPQYSGGLGILAGDHLKTASDMGIPIIGVGLFYRSGYFRQRISREGWQQELYPVHDPDSLPLSILREHDGRSASIVLAMPEGRSLTARIWVAQVGRVPLLMLDTNVRANDPDLRHVTDRLYGGGVDHRLRQELLLGIGGVRALHKYCEIMGTPVPEVFHSNEGHAGFLGVERLSHLIAHGLSFDEARTIVRAGTVFTVHTPVPAGIDRFPLDAVRRHFDSDLTPGVGVDDVLALGAEDDPSMFNMAHLGFALAQRANGVSKLHGSVARSMFSGLWPGFDDSEVPIASVTNGVHAPTWTAVPMQRLARDVLGTSDTTKADWASEALSDELLWQVRCEMRGHLVEVARERTVRRYERNEGVAPSWSGDVLDPDALTIGFARRGATYKRLTLMLHDPDRLRRLLTNPENPVQIVIAGKSHPADDEGKRLIQRVVQFAEDHSVRDRIVFLENYDIAMAKDLYPGCDVWLNNPLRPMEACGTSGMKAALNGALNLSILDGWWDEYFDGKNGWAIPSASPYLSPEERDDREAEALYEILEHEVVPRFYERDGHGIPRAWLAQVRHTLSSLSGELASERMLAQYVEHLYVPATASVRSMTADDARGARTLTAWRRRVITGWESLAITRVEAQGVDRVPAVGDSVEVRAGVRLGALQPDDVRIEVVAGPISEEADIHAVRSEELTYREAVDDEAMFSTRIDLRDAGTFGYTVRAVPRHPGLASIAELGLVTYAES